MSYPAQHPHRHRFASVVGHVLDDLIVVVEPDRQASWLLPRPAAARSDGRDRLLHVGSTWLVHCAIVPQASTSLNNRLEPPTQARRERPPRSPVLHHSMMYVASQDRRNVRGCRRSLAQSRLEHRHPGAQVGIFERFRKDKTQGPWPAAPALSPLPSAASSAAVSGPGFAIIDVETTGLSSAAHRVLELAIVRTDARGHVLDEWTCRFNPQGPVGASHIHGIYERDVATAPLFADVLPEISSRLSSAAVGGHNVRFDLAFLRAEYARAGWSLPFLPSLCTLEASYLYLPQLDRRRLSDCCGATGIAIQHAHSALGDARATATLLRSYLDPLYGLPPHPEHLAVAAQGSSVIWPTKPGGVRPPVATLPPRVQRKIKAPAVQSAALISLLGRMHLADALDDGAPEGSLPYLELLAEVLEDGVLSDDERASLADLAGMYDLNATARAAAHRGFMLALAHLALDDGKVSRTERAELTHIAALLDVPKNAVTALLDAAETARHERLSANLQPLPDDWTLGEPLRVGDKVVFTGCEDRLRERLEQRAEALGVRVMSSVNVRTAMLVTDGSFEGGKATDAAALGTRTVTPEVFETLLRHLQPAALTPAVVVPAQRLQPQPASEPVAGPLVEEGSSIPAVATASVAPAAVRSWARNNGYDVGVRGRLSAEIFDAYARAHAPAS
jgi:DNA polymerase-3 subunit epsilon